jgi:hypothetical protein
VARQVRVIERSYDDFAARLAKHECAAWKPERDWGGSLGPLAKPQAQQLVTLMLKHPAPTLRQTAFRTIGRQSGNVKKSGMDRAD